MAGWLSPRLGLRFEVEAGQLRLYDPSGQPLATYGEVVEQQQQARLRAEQERLRAEQERLRAEQAEASQRVAVPGLLAMGLSVEQVAVALALPLEVVSGLDGD